jgi:hypothetical protein
MEGGLLTGNKSQTTIALLQTARETGADALFKQG